MPNLRNGTKGGFEPGVTVCACIRLSAKYQIGAIHTSFLSVKVHPSWVSQAPRVLSYTQRILCDGLSPNPSEKVNRLYPPSIV